MSAVDIGVVWAGVTLLVFAALSASALGRTQHELEEGGEPSHTPSGHTPSGPPLTEAQAQWPALVAVAPRRTVLRCSPSAHMHAPHMHAQMPGLEPLARRS